MMQLLMLGLDLLNQRTEYLRMLKKVFYVSKFNIRGPRRPSDYFLIEFFFEMHKNAIMPILASEVLFRENKQFQLQNATLVSIEPLDL